MIKEFKEFIMRGSVLDLAVGVVIGSAFTAIVTQVVEGLITPLVSLIFVLTTGKKSADDALEDYLKEIRDLLAAQTPPAETVKTDSTFTEK